MFLRKKTAGSTSLGHTWDEDGAVVEVPDEHGHLLLRIRDAGFEIVDHLLHLDHGAPVVEGAVIEPGPASTLTEGGDGGEGAPEGNGHAGDGGTQGEGQGDAGSGADGGAEGGGDGAGDTSGDADAAATPAKRAPAKAVKAAAAKTA